MRLGIRSVLRRQNIPLEVDDAASSMELATRLRSKYYELILIEPALCSESVASCIKNLRQTAHWANILVFTGLDELTYGMDAIRSGATGYVMKTASVEEFLSAVRRVGSGKRYFSAALEAEFATSTHRYDSRIQPHQTLHKRELQVIAMAVCGMTVIESATVLQMSTETVNAFKRSAMLKLHVSTLNEMINYVNSHKLMDDCRLTSRALWSRCYVGDEPKTMLPATVWPFRTASHLALP